MRSPFAYTPRPGPLQSASPGAAVAYLGALVAVVFIYSSPLVLLAAGAAVTIAGLLAGARSAVRVAWRMGLALAVLIVVVNALVVSRGATVVARLGEWPWFGQVDVTLGRSSPAFRSGCGPRSRWSPSPSTRPASTPTGCCGRCGRSPAARL
jgi:energy-coupling factor transporter transmembrane protein EcfT